MSASLGLLSLFGGVTGIPAVVAGLIALARIKLSKGGLRGKGKAIAGISLGLFFSLLFFLVWSALRVPERSTMRMADANQLSQMAFAMENFESVYGYLPGSVPTDKAGVPLVGKGKPQLSWRVQLLPFLEQDNLYNQFHRDEPWDSPNNKRLIPLMPKIYHHPMVDLSGEKGGMTDSSGERRGMTVYRVFTGPRCAFRPGSDKLMHLSDIVDGRSNTILIAESAEPVIWTKPEEMEYDANQPVPKLGEYFRGRYQFVMFDGSIRTVPTSFSEKKLREAIVIDDGLPISSEW